jgi:transposase
MYVDSVKNRNSPPCILIRESYRDKGKIKKRTLANISRLPKAFIDSIKSLIKGASLINKPIEQIFNIVKSRAHGHVKAVIEQMNLLKMDDLLQSDDPVQLRLCKAMIAARILFPSSKLETTRALNDETAFTTLAQELEITTPVVADELYKAMDWLGPKQDTIEKALAQKHLKEGSIVLYDLTSIWVEGQCCALAKRGHNRDGNRKDQINIGLICDKQGRPVACEVFPGNCADPNTVKSQLKKLRERFGLDRITIVGDRGMLTQARIDEDLRHWEGVSWISALRAQSIGKLITNKLIQPELFDKEYVAAEIKSDDYPGERLVVCYNPALAQKRQRTRNSLIEATLSGLETINKATQRQKNPYHGKDKIAARIQRELGKYKMLKHFELEIGEKEFSWKFKEENFKQESRQDGIYVVRAKGVPKAEMTHDKLVDTYKSLSVVEQAFRSLKTVDLKVRPLYHWKTERVRAHVFLCMLAYYVEWHMLERLKPMLFADEQKDKAKASRPNAAHPVKKSDSAKAKAATKQTHAGDPVESFHSLMNHLGSITHNRVEIDLGDGTPKQNCEKITQPDKLQKQAFKLLGIKRFW